METKFTKGPWAANVWTCGRRSVYKALRTGNRGTPEIAEIWPTHDDDEHRANANLIAAAPEMYESLEKAWHALIDAAEELTTGNHHTPPELFMDRAASIDALLAKARGEQ